MKNPIITVVIDSYNYGHFIGQAIESVLKQDYPAEKMQVVVVDDGSTDGTREVVSKYGERVEYFHKANGGQASAFNFGIEKARGEYVALLDADDYWLPGKVRRVVEEFDKDAKLALVYHPFRELLNETEEFLEGGFNAVSGFVPRDKKKMLLFTATQTSGLTFRTELVKQLLPLNEAMFIQADGLLAALIIFLGPVKAIAEPLAIYRIHGANLYYDKGKERDAERMSRRIATLKVILEEMDRWLASHGYRLDQPEILAFRRRWQSLYETEEFHLRAPGRLRFFKHLWKAMHNMSPCLNRRIRLVNYINAAGSLFVGYRHYAKLDKWRINAKRALLG